MPRLTSFDSHEATPEMSGNEWSIREETKGTLFRPATFVAVRGEAVIPIGRDAPSPEGGIVRGLKRKPASNAYEQFEISMPSSIGKISFTLKPVVLGKYVAFPDIVSVVLSETRIHISIRDLGTAVFRPSWRDSDIAKKIHGFVVVDMASKDDEESLVWLAATLGMHDLPSFLSD